MKWRLDTVFTWAGAGWTTEVFKIDEVGYEDEPIVSKSLMEKVERIIKGRGASE